MSRLTPRPTAAGTVACPDFAFATGARIDQLLHYRTLGEARTVDGHVTNAVLLLHGTTGDGRQFLAPTFADHMFRPGQPLDTDRYYVVVPDAIGHGGSSKPSDPAEGAFPRYGFRDLIAGHRAVLRHLDVADLRLVLGTSMGGMQTWLWAADPPTPSDAYVAVACEPAPVTGRNLYWRQLIANALRSAGRDPGSHVGEVCAAVWPVFALISGSPESFDGLGRDGVDGLLGSGAAPDPMDLLYALEASWDYDPRPDDASAQVLAVSFDSDEVNPHRLSHLPDLARRLPLVTHHRLSVADAPDGHQSLHRSDLYAAAVAALLRMAAGEPVLTEGALP